MRERDRDGDSRLLRGFRAESRDGATLRSHLFAFPARFMPRLATLRQPFKAAQRHIGMKPAFQSNVLPTFDAEFARLQVMDTPRTVPSRPQDEERRFSLYSYKMHAPTSVRMYIRDEAEADEQVSKLKGYHSLVD